MILALSIALSLVSIIAIVAIVFAVRYAILLMQVEDNINRCVEILDEKYRIISEIHDIPLFYDSPEVRRLIDEIGKARDSVLYIVNILNSNVKDDVE